MMSLLLATFLLLLMLSVLVFDVCRLSLSLVSYYNLVLNPLQFDPHQMSLLLCLLLSSKWVPFQKPLVGCFCVLYKEYCRPAVE